MQRKLAARLHRQPERLRRLHPFQAHPAVPLGGEHGEQGGLAGRRRQLPQRPDRDRPQVGDRAGALPQLQRAGAEAEPLGLLVLADVAEALQGGEDPVHGRHRQVEGTRDLGGAPLGPRLAEDLEDAEGPLKNLEGGLGLDIRLAMPRS